MNDAFEQATRLQIAALESVIGEALTILHQMAPEDVELFHRVIDTRVRTATEDADLRLQQIKLRLYEDAIATSLTLQAV